MANLQHRNADGCFMYSAVGTRPDLAPAAGALSQIAADPMLDTLADTYEGMSV